MGLFTYYASKILMILNSPPLASLYYYKPLMIDVIVYKPLVHRPAHD